MKLSAWFAANQVPAEMYCKSAFEDQVTFVRDEIASLVGEGLDSREIRAIPEVISTHRSSSIVLPVYSLERKDIGLRIILRNNFHDWKLSVISETPLEIDFGGLFHTSPPPDPDYTGDSLHPVYFDGFPEDLIFGYYCGSDRKRFSAKICGRHALWTAVWLIMKAKGAIKPFVWNTRKR